jgi:hypothetical protein
VAGARPCAIAIAGELELDGVREALRALAQPFEEWQRGGPVPDAANPARLFVCSVSRALTASYNRRRTPGIRGAVWIAVATRESLSRRQNLIDSGFDYLVRWPMHSGALQMLLAGALYQGAENRQVARLAVGHPVRIKLGRSHRPAMLVDISPRGARLFSGEEVEPGSKAVLELPAELMGDKPLGLSASVVRSRQGAQERGSNNEFSLGLRFDPLEHSNKLRLAALLRRLSVEPASVKVASAAPGPRGPRTRAKRARFSGEVMAYSAAAGEWRLISGRNLSLGGMCADPHPALRVGKTVELAFEVGGGPPIEVRAEVVRENREAGVGLRFAPLSPADQARLKALVDSLPSIESLAPSTPPTPLVAQLLGRFRKPR